MKGHRINFFATRNDMLEVFKGLRLRFIPRSQNDSPDIKVYESAEDIPELDVNRSGRHMSVNYTVTEEKSDVTVARTEFADGRIGYQTEIMYSDTPKVRFSPSGFTLDGRCLVHGLIDCLEGDAAAEKLYKDLCTRIKRLYRSFSGWWVGPEAAGYVGKVRLVTIDAASPEIYDLKTENEK